VHRNVVAATLLGMALVACSDSPTAVNPQVDPSLLSASRPSTARRFIITLREGTNPAGVAREHGVQPDHVYTHALNGFAGSISDAARQGLLRDSRVVRVEPDGIATIVTTQSGATWGLDRVDQRSRPLSTTYSYRNTGAGVRAYIIDTGIRVSHSEFGTRAAKGYDVFGGLGGDDCNGHGTHVAGSVGGKTYGVAKGVKLVAVRVLFCDAAGPWSDVIAGIDWVTAHRVRPAVANISLGGPANASVDDAVKNLIAAGVATVVAAGNGEALLAQNACKYSPARVAAAMTIGATDKADRKASWSNYGNCLDWFAPGVNITSAWYTSTTATMTLSGTSMAAPHTTGVAALYLQSHTTASPATVRGALYTNTTKGKVTISNTANNHLLFSNY
jgi:subtilisin family serine protease